MTAKEIMSPGKTVAERGVSRIVDADMPLLEVLPRLLDTPLRELGVSDGEVSLGVIDQASMLEGLGKMIAARDDCSVVTVECRPEEYSASHLAHAVEDSDAHLVDLLTTPSAEGKMRVTLRIRHTDPTAAVHNLERYGYEVVKAYSSHGMSADMGVSVERLMSLQTLLNV